MAFTDRSPIIMQGKVFIQERQFNGPATSGLVWVGNADKAMLSFKQKRETITDNFTGKGLTIAAPVVETSIEFMLSMMDISSDNMARTSWGSWSGAQAGGSVASESVVLYNDSFVQLSRLNVSNVVVSGATLTTDYVVDSAAHGRLYVPATSTAAPAGSPLTTTVAYDYAASNGKVEGFTYGQKFYSIVIDGINVAQGNQPHVLRIHQIQLDAMKQADFISKKQMNLDTGGEILVDSTISDDGTLSQVFWHRRA